MDEFLIRINLQMFEVNFLNGSSGTTLRATHRVDPAVIPPNKAFHFSTPGSGFVLGKANSEVRVGGRLVTAILATAAHAYGLPAERMPDAASVELIDGNSPGAHSESELLHYFASLDIAPSWDPSTNACYPLPNDLALALLYDNTNVSPFEIGRPQLETPVITVGKPVRPIQWIYAAPVLANSTTSVKVYEQSVTKALLGFRYSVYSEGRIVSKNSEHLGITCSTCNGMSGSPVFRTDNKQLVGMVLGGPVVPGMHEATKLAQDVLEHKPDKQISEEMDLLETILQDLQQDALASIIRQNFNADFGRHRGVFATVLHSIAADLISLAKDELHNICLSVESRAFSQALQAVREFEAMGRMDFPSVEALRKALHLD